MKIVCTVVLWAIRVTNDLGLGDLHSLELCIYQRAPARGIHIYQSFS
jgi:hypothetical protein